LGLASAINERGSAHGSTVVVWDLAKGREVRRFAGHRGSVNAVAFTPDGRSVISGSEDATVLVWDVSDLKDYSKTDEPLTPESLQARWDELAGNDARAAYRAAWALSVPSAVGFLRDHLKVATMAETITSPEVLRRLRAITALEHVHTPEARAVIERLTQGAPDAITTREAKATLERLNRAMGRGEPRPFLSPIPPQEKATPLDLTTTCREEKFGHSSVNTTVVTTVVRPWFGRAQPPTSHVSAMFPADRADARGWRTFVPSEPCTYVHSHGVQAPSRRWCSARSLEKTIADRNGDHFTETHEFQPGPHLTEKVVPSRTVTDRVPDRTP
jgi:hypothetical protein